MRDATDTTSGNLPIAWFSDSDSSAAHEFARSVGSRAPVFAAEGSMRILDVRAVPTAFLITPTDRVALIFPYGGSVAGARLRPYCAREESS